MNEDLRRTADVLIDHIVAFDETVAEEHNLQAMAIPLQRLVEAGACAAVYDPSSNKLDLNLDPLLGASVLAITWLVVELAIARGTDRHTELARLRELFAERDDTEAAP